MSTLDRDQQFQTTTASGRPVKDRITTVAAARGLHVRLWEAASADSLRRLRIKGQVDGRPPYDPERLKELGLGYITNVNFLELRALLDERADKRFASYVDVPVLACIKDSMPYAASDDAPNYGSIVAEEFTRLLKEDWPGFYPLMDFVGRQGDMYGLGVAMFRDEWDWRPEERDVSNFMPDPHARVNLEHMSMFCINGTFRVAELFEILEDTEAAAAAGWNVSALRDIIVRVYYKEENQDVGRTGPTKGNMWEELEQRYRNNDPVVQIHELDEIEVVHVVYAQVSDGGGVGHKIFPRTSAPDDQFLFEAPNRFESMEQVLLLFPYNYGDGQVKSCRGIASYVEQHSDLSNRYLGSAFDAARTAGTLLVQPRDARATDSMTVQRMGILTVVDSRLNIQQSSFQPRINDLIALRRVSSDLMQNNTREQMKEAVEDPEYRPAQKTAEEVRNAAAMANRGESQRAIFYAVHYQKMYREMLRRLCNVDYLFSEARYPGQELALKFACRCVERGVPLEILLDFPRWRVNAVVPVGGGSPMARKQALRSMMEIRGEADEKGRAAIVRDYAASEVGYDNVDRYFPMRNRDSIPTNETSIATLETNDFRAGSSGVVGSDQNHVIHLSVHVPPVQEIIQAVEEQGVEAVDPGMAKTFLSAALEHIQGHLEYLQRVPNRKDVVRQGVELLRSGIAVLNKITKYLEKLQQMQEQMAQQQGQALADAQQQAFSNEQQLELEKARMKNEIEALKQQSLNQMRAMKTQEQNEINRRRTEANIEIASRRADADIEIKRRKAEVDAALAQAKAARNLQ